MRDGALAPITEGVGLFAERLSAIGAVAVAIAFAVAPCADAATVTPVAGASVLVGTPGADLVNAADGRAEEVWCGGGRDVVRADPMDRVWGDCEMLNGRAWQADRIAGRASGSADLDAVGGTAGWIDRGRLTLLAGGRVRPRVWPSGRLRASDLDLGRDVRGRPVAVARVCAAGRPGCGRWLAYDLATGRSRPLRLSPPAGCAVSSVAVWRRWTALGATCGIGEQRVYAAAGRQAWRLLLTAPPSSAPGGVRVDAGPPGVAAWVGGHAWLLGAAPCAQALDETLAGARRPAVSGPPRFAGDRVVWPQSAWAAGEADWVTVARVGPRCSVASRRYAIVAHRARAAAIAGTTLLTLVGRTVERRPLATVPGPLEPPPPPAPPPPPPPVVIAEAAPPPAPPPSPYAALVESEPSLAGFWRLDESAPVFAGDSRSGGTPGRYVGHPGLGTQGAIAGDPDTAMTLDGTGQYVEVDDRPDLSPAGAFTQEAWFDLDPAADPTTDHAIVSRATWPYGYVLEVAAGGRLVAAVSAPSGYLTARTPDPVAPGQWHHAAAVFDGRSLALYLDGALVATSAQPNPFALAGVTGPFRIGAQSLGGSLWQGSLDEVALYGAALPAATIARHYALGDGRPGVQTETPSARDATSEDVTGEVDPNGLATTWHVEYGTTTSYGSQTDAGDAGGASDDAPVSATLTGLQTGTTYHYRLVATSSAGTRAGADRTFVAGGYRNPVSDEDFPDPQVLADGGDLYAYGTGALFPIMRSKDLVSWRDDGTAFDLAHAPSWVTGDWFGPSVVSVAADASHPCPGFDVPAGGRCFYLFYTGLAAMHDGSSVHCVGVATSDRPDGGFVDHGILAAPDGQPGDAASDRPAGCGDDSGYGNVDPDAFVDPATGKAYLYFTTEYGCSSPGTCSLGRTLSELPLSDDLLHAAGPRVPLLPADASSWEGGVVEGPAMVAHDSKYFLFYSGGDWRTSGYGMGVAVGSSPTGPFTRSPDNPILASAPGADGPGGGSVVAGPATGDDELVYHARSAPGAGPRTLRVDRLVWDDAHDRVTVDGPSTDVRPLP